jgi:tRNA 2-thiouridine synthesizing protein B
MLHTVNKSPFDKNSLDTCLKLAKAGSSILLIEDGVYAALKGTAVEGKVREAAAKHKVYALAPDLRARGMEEGRVIDGIALVDYAGFVDLVEASDKVQAWL